MSRSANEICTEMGKVRCDLGSDVERVVTSAQEMADWKAYVRRYPWVCVAAAAAVSYAVVPKRVELVSPDADALIELAKRDKLVVKSDPKPQAKAGLTGTAFGLLANVAMRGAVAYIGQLMGQTAGEQAADVRK